MDSSHLPRFSVSVCLSLSGRVCVLKNIKFVYICVYYDVNKGRRAHLSEHLRPMSHIWGVL